MPKSLCELKEPDSLMVLLVGDKGSESRLDRLPDGLGGLLYPISKLALDMGEVGEGSLAL